MMSSDKEEENSNLHFIRDTNTDQFDEIISEKSETNTDDDYYSIQSTEEDYQLPRIIEAIQKRKKEIKKRKYDRKLPKLEKNYKKIKQVPEIENDETFEETLSKAIEELIGKRPQDLSFQDFMQIFTSMSDILTFIQTYLNPMIVITPIQNLIEFLNSFPSEKYALFFTKVQEFNDILYKFENGNIFQKRKTPKLISMTCCGLGFFFILPRKRKITKIIFNFIREFREIWTNMEKYFPKDFFDDLPKVAENVKTDVIQRALSTFIVISESLTKLGELSNTIGEFIIPDVSGTIEDYTDRIKDEKGNFSFLSVFDIQTNFSFILDNIVYKINQASDVQEKLSNTLSELTKIDLMDASADILKGIDFDFLIDNFVFLTNFIKKYNKKELNLFIKDLIKILKIISLYVEKLERVIYPGTPWEKAIDYLIGPSELLISAIDVMKELRDFIDYKTLENQMKLLIEFFDGRNEILTPEGVTRTLQALKFMKEAYLILYEYYKYGKDTLYNAINSASTILGTFT